jgi:ankyrin repeat protein
MTGAAIVIDDAAANDLIWIIKDRVFAANRKLAVHRQRLVYRPGPRGMEALADNETLGDAGVAQDGSAELDLLMEPLTEKDEALLCYTLLEASRCGRANDVISALEEGADVQYQGAHGGYSSLFMAALGGYTDCVRVLIDAGANLEAAEQGGYTALMISAGRGHADCARLLLGAGCDVDAKNVLGQTALVRAACGNHVACVRLLLDAGCDKVAKDESGRTALMHAALEGHTECVWLLLDAGVDKMAVNEASSVALQNGHADVARMIAGHGIMSLADDTRKQVQTAAAVPLTTAASIDANTHPTSKFRV